MEFEFNFIPKVPFLGNLKNKPNCPAVPIGSRVHIVYGYFSIVRWFEVLKVKGVRQRH